jgi:hypothetical protein
MSHSFLVCSNCGDTFHELEEGVVSCDCGDGEWCCMECAKEGGYRRDEDNEESTCNYCRGEDVRDDELLAFLFEKTGLTREQAVTEYNQRHAK